MTSSTARNLAISAALAVSAASAAAHAESEHHAACFEKRLSDACFREGKHQYAEGNEQAAYEAYLQGWELDPDFQVAANLGNVEYKLEEYAPAYTHLKYALENLPAMERGGEAEEKLRDRLSQVLEHVGGRRFKTEPTDATVSIDGETLGDNTRELWIGLDPGEHALAVSADGYQTIERTIEVRARSEEAETFVLLPVESGPIEPHPPSVGDEEGGMELSIPIVVAGSVVAVGAIGAGIGLHVVAASKGDERAEIASQIDNTSGCANPIEEDATRCQQVSELADEESTFSAAGIGLLIGGGAVGAATAIYAIVVATSGGDGDAEDPVADEGVSFRPAIGPRFTGATLSGSF